MRKDYVKNPISEEISEEGGAVAQFVNKTTVPLDGAIDEAVAGNYCLGNKTLIRNLFFGLMQSIADGIQRDGHPRQLANNITIYPVVTGEIDLDKGYDREVNSVKIRARLLNELTLDTSNWSFNDVTPGKRSFTLQSVKAGEELGVFAKGEKCEINGKNLPSTEAGEPLAIHWEIDGTEKSGDIAFAKMTSNVSRIDIAADAITGITQDDDGKDIVFTVRGNYSSGKIVAKVKFVPEPTPITKVCYRDAETHEMVDGLPSKGEFTLVTTGHRTAAAERGDKVKLTWTDGEGVPHEAFADVDCYNETDGGVDCFSLESKGLSIVDGTQVTCTLTDEEGTASVTGTWLDLG